MKREILILKKLILIYKISVGEKRIFAPNYIYVEKGTAKKLIAGTSDLQKNSRDELTKEILEDEEKIFQNFFNK